MQKWIVVIMLINFFLTLSCRKKCRERDDKLTIPKTEYIGTLKTNGYYHTGLFNNNHDVFVLYRNGITLDTHPSSLQQFEDGMSNASYRESKFGWGAFQIENRDIQIETWSHGMCEYPVYRYSGYVINDSAFVITESYRIINKENYLKLNDTFYFKQTAAKPDSTQPYL